nr:MAG TPA: hypothetical protein [Caudoviricetes sp.]
MQKFFFYFRKKEDKTMRIKNPFRLDQVSTSSSKREGKNV